MRSTVIDIRILVFLIAQVSCLPVCVSDVAALSMCMRSLFDTWEHIRNVESHAANLLLPVPFYTKESTLVLCNEYMGTKERCFPDEESCPSSTMFSFVRGQLGFFCGPMMPLYIKNYDCISASLLKSRHCLQSIFGMPNPLNMQDRCRGLPKFFSCVTSSLEKDCGRLPIALLAAGIQHFGCVVKDGTRYLHDLARANDTQEFTYANLKEFIQRERPMNFEELRKSKEIVTPEVPAPTTGSTPTEVTSTIGNDIVGTDSPNEETLTSSEASTESSSSREITTSATEITEKHKTHTFVESTESTISAEKTTTAPEKETPKSIVELPSTPSQPVSVTQEPADLPKMLSETGPRSRSIESVPLEKQSQPEISTEHDVTTETTSTSTEILDIATIIANEVTSAEMLGGSSSDATPSPASAETATIVDSLRMVDATNTSSDVMTCSEEDEHYVNACHANLVRRLSSLSGSASSKVRFPLFNMTSDDVIAVCRQYDQGSKCAEEQLNRCADIKILSFLDVQFQAICFRIDSMKSDYDCLRATLNENTNCVTPITGVPDDVTDMCSGQQAAFDCFVSLVECRQGATTLYKEAVRGIGCRVDVKPWLTRKPTTPVTTTRRPRTTTVEFSLDEQSSNSTIEEGTDGLNMTAIEKENGQRQSTVDILRSIDEPKSVDTKVDKPKDHFESVQNEPTTKKSEESSTEPAMVEDRMDDQSGNIDPTETPINQEPNDTTKSLEECSTTERDKMG